MAHSGGTILSSHTFRDQRIAEHVQVIVVGALLGIVSYVYLAMIIGGQGAVAADGMAAARRTAIAMSGFLVGAYLARAFVRGVGGPLLNLLYLLAHLVLTPVAAVYVGGGSMPEHFLLGGDWLSVGSVLEALLVVVIPLSTYVLGQALWFRHRCSAEERIWWANDHLPEPYRDTLFDPSRFDRGRDTDGSG